MPKREHTIHLVQDKDKTKKACDGTPYKSPESIGAVQPGDVLHLCQACALGRRISVKDS